MKKPMMVNLLVLIGTLILFFAAFELATRAFYGTHLAYENDDELYWKLKPSQTGFPTSSSLRDYAMPQARINSDGFRGEELNLSGCNLMVLGDSFTFGQGVMDNETYPYILGGLLGDGFEVINAGVSGWGLFQENILFKRIHEKYDPDIVILMLISDDLRRVPFASESKKNDYLEWRREGPLGRLESLHLVFIGLNGIFRKELGAADNYLAGEISYQEMWMDQKRYVEEIDSIQKGKNKTFIMAYYRSTAPESSVNATALPRLMESTLDDGIHFIGNFSQELRGVPQDQLYVSKRDRHPSPQAHGIIARRLYQEISNSDDIPINCRDLFGRN